jgi:hypothetical protein
MTIDLRGPLPFSMNAQSLRQLGLLLFLACTCASCIPATSGQTAATITANPPLLEEGDGLGRTVITWDTGDGSIGQVYVSVNGEPAAIFAQGPNGTAEAHWILNNTTYIFTLYKSNGRTELASITVSRGEKLNIPLYGKPIWFLLLIPLGSIAVLLWGQWLASKNGFEVRYTWVVKVFTILVTAYIIISIASLGRRSLNVQTPDSQEYADAARQLLLGNGYVTTYHFGTAENIPGLLPATHPPGFSLALVPFMALPGDPEINAQIGSKFYMMLYVIMIVAVAWTYGGPLAAGIASVLTALSSFVYVTGSFVLSDPFAAMLTIAIPLFLNKISRWKIIAVALLAGFAVLVRFPMIFNIAAIFIAVPAQYRKRLLFYVGFPLAILFIYQWATFGHPLLSGLNYYLPEQKMFNFANIYRLSPFHDGNVLSGDNFQNKTIEWLCQCTEQWPNSQLPNSVFYVLLVLGIVWVYAPPFAVLPGIAYIIKNRQIPAASFALWLGLLSLAFHILFFAQERRYMAGPIALLVAFAAVAASHWVKKRAEAANAARQSKLNTATL